MDDVILNHDQVTRTIPEEAPPSFPNSHTTPMGGCLSFDRLKKTRIFRTVLGSNSRHVGNEFATLTTRLPWQDGIFSKETDVVFNFCSFTVGTSNGLASIFSSSFSSEEISIGVTARTYSYSLTYIINCHISSQRGLEFTRLGED
ncbi:hypothetical protein TNCV_393581 [Trichonephila clavipes]|nr:hypothetical protein TNCV_393581 [Trichonephila clavipes]